MQFPRRVPTSTASSMTVATTSSFPRLMGDVGGTNARFAVQEAPEAAPTQVVTYPSAEYETIADALPIRSRPRPRGATLKFLSKCSRRT